MISISRFIAFPKMRMLMVGALSISTSYTVFLFLIALGIHYQVASVSNFLVYWVISFLLNRTWAFKSSGNIKKQAVRYLCLHLSNQVMIMIGLYVLVEWVDIVPAWSQIIMQLIATVVVFILTPIIFQRK